MNFITWKKWFCWGI